jgi:hypothetical protein
MKKVKQTQTDRCKRLGEKIKERREQKIAAIVASMATWDDKELLTWAQDARRGFLNALDADTLDEEYVDACNPDR